jgi:hypothetical protein
LLEPSPLAFADIVLKQQLEEHILIIAQSFLRDSPLFDVEAACQFHQFGEGLLNCDPIFLWLICSDNLQVSSIIVHHQQRIPPKHLLQLRFHDIFPEIGFELFNICETVSHGFRRCILMQESLSEGKLHGF